MEPAELGEEVEVEVDEKEAIAELAGLETEAFRRQFMRIVTSLRRLQHLVSLEIDSLGVRFTTQPEKVVLWKLIRRMTRRIEKLKMLRVILQEKRRRVRSARASSAADDVRSRSTSEILPLCAASDEEETLVALLQKLSVVVSECEDLESVAMNFALQRPS